MSRFGAFFTRTTPSSFRRWVGSIAWLCASLLLLGLACRPPTETQIVPLSSQPAPLRLGPLLAPLIHATRTSPQTQQAHLALISPLLTTRRQQQDLAFRILLQAHRCSEVLRQLHIPHQAHGTQFATAWVTLSQLTTLAQQPELRRLAFSRRLTSHLNVSGPFVFAPQARYQHGVDGRGVIVGIIDTGIDYQHPTFRRPDGTTRILAILDFSLPDPRTKEPPTLFTASMINDALRTGKPLPHIDDSGHGTHVAGIAAGNGRTRETDHTPRYIGMAPRADLVIIKGTRKDRTDFDSGDVLHGVQYIHQTARYLDKPFVVNLSLGGHHGGHDGNTLLEQLLRVYSNPTKPGQIIVASAGNEGSELIHASGWLQGDKPLIIPLSFPAYDSSASAANDNKIPNARITMELWLPLDASISYAIQTPSGFQTDWMTADTLTGQPIQRPEGHILLSHRYGKTAPTGQRVAFLFANPQQRALRHGTWKIILKGQTKRFDLWLTDSTYPKGAKKPFIAGYTSQEMLIGLPGSSASVLTVGSYNSRQGWSAATGVVVERPVETGELSSFSSPGPTRDGRPKPDVVAPGLYVASAAPLSLPPDSPGKMPDGSYQISQGTSQAAPHLTGGVALLLQVRPELDIDTIRRLLVRNTHTDSFTAFGGVFDKGWGFGKLHLLHTINTLQWGTSKEPVSSNTSTLGIIAPWLPADGQSQTRVIIIPKDAKGQAHRGNHQIALKTSLGRIEAAKQVQTGIYEAVLTSSATPGTATIEARIDGITLKTSQTIEFRPPSPQQSTAGGCGCQIVAPIRQRNGWLLVPLFFILVFSSRPTTQRKSSS